MIRRRTFLITCGSAVAAPVFAQLALPPTPRREWTAGDMTVSTASATAPGPAKIALRIDGWVSPAGSEPDVWVQINSSWRATWR